MRSRFIEDGRQAANRLLAARRSCRRRPARRSRRRRPALERRQGRSMACLALPLRAGAGCRRPGSRRSRGSPSACSITAAILVATVVGPEGERACGVDPLHEALRMMRRRCVRGLKATTLVSGSIMKDPRLTAPFLFCVERLICCVRAQIIVRGNGPFKECDIRRPPSGEGSNEKGGAKPRLDLVGWNACQALCFTGMPLSAKSCCSSPAWNISRVMSQPPTNSPFT